MNTRREAKLTPVFFHPPSREQTNRPLQRRSRKAISRPIVVGVVRLVDLICVPAGGCIAALSVATQPPLTFQSTVLFIALATIALTNVAPIAGAYRPEMLWSWMGSMNRVLLSWLFVVGTIFLIALAMTGLAPPPKTLLEIWALATTVSLVLTRAASGQLFVKWRDAGRLQRRAVILGAGPVGQRLIEQLTASPHPEVEIVGLYDDRKSRLPPTCHGYAVRGNLDDLIADARIRPVDHVFVALPLSADWRLAEILNKLCLIAVDVRLCLGNFGFQLGECEVTHVGGLTTLNVCESPVKGWQYVAKFIEDKVFATLILALVAPLMAVVAVLIKLDSPGPILFRQRRHGLNNELIEVLKFRTLYDDARDVNADRLCVNNDPRITRVGAFLRRSMLDELPQFINVLRGDMSIVGPRPHALAAKAGGLLYREAVKYYDARHRMKPGITGWAQIHGWRGETRTVEEIDQRVAHDLYYIHHWSIPLDLQIIVRTAFDAFMGVVRKKPGKPRKHAMPLANTGRSRSAA